MRRPLMIFATVALLATGCGGGSAGDSDGTGPILVGQIVSLTGNYSPLGSENKKSVELAVAQINDSGGIGGREVELVVKDDKSQPDQSVLAFNELRGQDVVAVIGSPFSNSALATIPLVDREEIPYLSPSPADEQVDPVHPYVFMVPATSATYGERILEYFRASGITRVAIAHDTKSSYAVAGYDGMRANAERYGVDLVTSEEFQTDATEFGSVFNDTRDAGAQALVVWATGAPAVALTKQYATAGLSIPLMLTGAQASKLFLDPVGPAAEGVLVAGSVGVVGEHLPEGELKKAIAELAGPFQTEHGYPPPQFAQDGYSAMKLLAAAIERAGGTDRAKIRDALEGLTLVTPNGKYAYSATDHSGLPGEYIAITAVRDGTLVPTDWTRTQLAGLAG